MFRRLQAALSTRITETMAAKEGDAEKENAGEGSDGTHSPSSCSTVSSSGAVQGEYLVNPDEPQAEEEGSQEQPREREEEELEEDSGEPAPCVVIDHFFCSYLFFVDVVYISCKYLPFI